MSDFFRARLDDSEFQRFATNFPRAVYNATRSAHRSTATWERKRIIKKISDKYQIPIKTLKEARKDHNEQLRKSRISAKRSKDFYSSVTEVWGELPAKKSADDSFVGKLTQTQGGAKAGKKFFQNGFIATLRSGRTAIFKRVGNTRKIETQKIEMENAGDELLSDASEVSIEFKRRFESKMQQYIERGVVIDDSGDINNDL
jgi:hypothetical protein